MEFSFNSFFGYEAVLNHKPEIVIFGALLIPVALSIFVAILGGFMRKLKINMYLIYTLLYTLLFTFVFGLFAVFILYMITEKSGTKLSYCWITIFIGMFIFSLLNTNAINKMFSDWSKMKKD